MHRKSAAKPLRIYWPFGSLQWRHNESDGVSNHQPYDSLLDCLLRRRSKKTSKLRVTGLCGGNSPVIGEFPAQRASNAEMFPFDDVIMWRNYWCQVVDSQYRPVVDSYHKRSVSVSLVFRHCVTWSVSTYHAYMTMKSCIRCGRKS